MSEAEVAVRDNKEQSRFEVTADGELAGFAAYKMRGDLVAFIHTEVDDAFEGQGLGSKLVRFALDSARDRRLSVLPFCPFVNAWIDKHPEYADLVPAEHRDKFGL